MTKFKVLLNFTKINTEIRNCMKSDDFKIENENEAEAELLNLSASIMLGDATREEIEKKMPTLLEWLGTERIKKEFKDISEVLGK